MPLLRAKLYEIQLKEANAKERSQRLSQVGTGDRRKIRTIILKITGPQIIDWVQIFLSNQFLLVN